MREQFKQNFTRLLGSTSPHFLLLFVLLLIGMVYSNTLNSPPVLDDQATFIDNHSIYLDNLSLDSLKQIYDGKFGHGAGSGTTDERAERERAGVLGRCLDPALRPAERDVELAPRLSHPSDLVDE